MMGLSDAVQPGSSVTDCVAAAPLRALSLPAVRMLRTLPQVTRAEIVDAAEAALVTDWPDLPAALFSRFCADGNRVAFEAPYFQRRRLLNALVLGELVEGAGRYLGAIRRGVSRICSEAAWQLPAHNRTTRGGPIAPEPLSGVVDLFAAETAAQLAVVHHLFGKDLVDDLAQTVTARVLTPYIEREFWWTGRLGGRMNNWTVWCTQNVLLAAFLLPCSDAMRREVVARAACSIDAFLAEYGDDGACPEGAYYYTHAALCLFTALDVLNTVTDGAVAVLFQTEKLRNIAEFILFAHIAQESYANFGDAAARMRGPDPRAYRLAQAVGSERLMGFVAAHGAGDDPEAINLYDRLGALTCDVAPAESAPVEGYLPSIGMFVARDDRFYVAANAGHNGADHNHNDVGNVIVFKDGQPVLIDVGVETYCAKTFSKDRYDIWTMQSSFHNLPEFDGRMQRDGAQSAAREVEVCHGAARAWIDMDIAGAYAGADVQSYSRRVTLSRGGAVEIDDRITAGAPVVLNLMLAEAPQITGRVLQVGAAQLSLTGVRDIAVEEIPVTDARLAQSWNGPLYRARLTPEADHMSVVVT